MMIMDLFFARKGVRSQQLTGWIEDGSKSAYEEKNHEGQREWGDRYESSTQELSTMSPQEAMNGKRYFGASEIGSSSCPTWNQRTSDMEPLFMFSV